MAVGDLGSGARIKLARQAAGLTQDGLAAAVGVSRSAVAQWETERSGQVGANLARVAALLGVSPAYLLTGEGAPEGGDGPETSQERSLLRLYRHLNEEDRAFLMRTAVMLERQARGSRRG